MSMLLEELDDVLYAVRATVRGPEFRRRLLAGIDLPGGISTLRVLRVVDVLRSDEGGPTIRDVAQRLGIEHSTASRAVDVACRAQLVQRERSEVDRRKVLLTLTSVGASVLSQTSARRRELFGIALAGWAEPELTALLAVLQRLVKDFDSIGNGQ